MVWPVVGPLMRHNLVLMPPVWSGWELRKEGRENTVVGVSRSPCTTTHGEWLMFGYLTVYLSEEKQ